MYSKNLTYKHYIDYTLDLTIVPYPSYSNTSIKTMENIRQRYPNKYRWNKTRMGYCNADQDAIQINQR